MAKCDDNDEEDVDEIEEALCKISRTKKLWIITLFLLASFPGILNGMHITSYIFFVGNVTSHCHIPILRNASWSFEEIDFISTPPNDNNHERGCKYYDFDYMKIAALGFQNASKVFDENLKSKSKILKCEAFEHSDEETVISEWNLVCDQYYLRSNIQAAFALGKLLGAVAFGLVADKFGRKFSFCLAGIFYMISAPLAAFSTSYEAFLFVRFVIGLAGIGVYETAYTLLSEITVGSARNCACSLFNISYPIGMVILAIAARYLTHWRHLQMFMSIPSLFLVAHFIWLPESPRWLMSQGREIEAWKIITSVDPSIVVSTTQQHRRNIENVAKIRKSESDTRFVKCKSLFRNLTSLFSTRLLVQRSIICLFISFAISLAYYGIVLSGENFSINRYWYVALNGILEMISYVLPIPLLAYFGRKTTSFGLLLCTGISLIAIPLFSYDSKIEIITVALFARFCVSSACVVFAVYTADLFPTIMRNTAVGASLMMAHVGTVAAPYIVNTLGGYGWYIPSVIFGCFTIVCIFVIAPLPETQNRRMRNSIDERMEMDHCAGMVST